MRELDLLTTVTVERDALLERVAELETRVLGHETENVPVNRGNGTPRSILEAVEKFVAAFDQFPESGLREWVDFFKIHLAAPVERTYTEEQVREAFYDADTCAMADILIRHLRGECGGEQ